MINPEVILAKTGESKPLSEIALTGDIAACPANIASLCMCIAALAEERKLWQEPSKEMIQAGLAEVQRMLDEWEEASTFTLEVSDVTDAMASDMAVFILQAMASKRTS